ncbi:MAG: adenosylcobinamide-phosphate synthase CbiB [Ktedonobacteraceae bacterium]
MMKQNHACSFPFEKGLAVGVALGVDFLGEPPAICHPVIWYGKVIHWLEQSAPQRSMLQFLYGAGMLVVAVPVALVPALCVQMMVKELRTSMRKQGVTRVALLLSSLLEGVALKPFFALHLLVISGSEVRLALEQEDLDAARSALQALVSRDRSHLTPSLVAAAAVESLAENLSDSVVAPLLYYLVLGIPGAAAYRLFNTFDSMVGYHGRYEYLGKAAARLDDVLNLLPSRLTALLIIACAPLFGGETRRAWRIWRRDARKTASPNAGHPMAACAGALGIQLEKVGSYTLGDDERLMIPHDIQRAEHMVWWIGIISLALTALCKSFWRTGGNNDHTHK